MRKKILLSKPIREHSPQSLLDFIKSIHMRKEGSKESKTVPGITITFGKRTIVRLKDKNRIFTDEEIKLLAQEYAQDYQPLLDLLVERKVKIINPKGELYGSTPKPRAPKGNVKRKRTPRKKISANKLLESGPSIDMLPEVSLPLESATQESGIRASYIW